MKIRTDFVTNSSSSSFIFEKGTDFQKVKKEAEQLFPQIVEQLGENVIMDKENREFLHTLETSLKRISTLEWYGQNEIFRWYESRRMQQIVDKESEDVKQWSKETKEYCFCNTILEVVWRCTEGKGVINYDNLMIELQEFYDNDIFCYQRVDDRYLKRYEMFMLEYWDELKEYCMQLKKEGVTSGMLLEKFYNCEYILYDSDRLAVPYPLSEVLGETKGCLWSCTHMG